MNWKSSETKILEFGFALFTVFQSAKKPWFKKNVFFKPLFKPRIFFCFFK